MVRKITEKPIKRNVSDMYKEAKEIITEGLNSNRYKVTKKEDFIYEVFDENGEYICRIYEVDNDYYLPPNSINYKGALK